MSANKRGHFSFKQLASHGSVLFPIGLAMFVVGFVGLSMTENSGSTQAHVFGIVMLVGLVVGAIGEEL